MEVAPIYIETGGESEYNPCSTCGSTGGGGGNLPNPNPPPVVYNDTQVLLTPMLQPWEKVIECMPFFSDNLEITSWLQNNKHKAGSLASYLKDEQGNCVNENLDFGIPALEAMMNEDEVDFDELYIETLSPDDNYDYQGSKQLITNPLILSNGNEISIEFGKTRSDGLSANQEVATELVNGIKFALEEANNNLSSTEQINSIYIMATTNGKHGSTSNHPKGTAVDISRINGKKMILTGLNNQIIELQKAFDNFDYIRENFGPYFKHKYEKASNTWNYYHPVGGHKDHIHVSIRR